MLLHSKSKFDIRSPSKDRPFSPEQFFSWSNNHMYRTAYNDMKCKVSLIYSCNCIMFIEPIWKQELPYSKIPRICPR